MKATRFTAAAMMLALLLGCASSAEDITRDSRLAMIETTAPGLEQPVTIYWNDYQVPYIVAQTDTDLAYALGVVQGHLREAQMQLLKRVAQGRLSEMFGPLTTEIDEALRILDFGYAAPAMVADLPAETRAWLDAFVAGLNHNQENAPPPLEASWLAWETEPWTVEDVLTIGRLAGTDVGWLVYFSMLQAQEDQDFEELWERVLTIGTGGTTSFDATTEQRALSEILAGTSKSGSNSLVVAPELSATGHALMANDPHLGLILPNLWLIVGIQSPSYHAVGFMLPGLPFLGLGRNSDLAWGGTNMRAAASDLFDVSAISEDEITTTRDTIGTRFWFDQEITTRRTPWGPIITDAEVLPGEDIAVRWMGHEPSDEVTAFLDAMRASDAEGFRQSFETYAVSGQNMLFVTKTGDIGQLAAVRLPRRNGYPETLIRDIETHGSDWDGFVGAMDLPWSLNPPEGFLASANNKPTTPTPVPLGYFFSDDDRIDRLQTMLRERAPIDRADLIAIQTDVTSIFAAELAAELLARFDAGGTSGPILDDFRGWDGEYAPDARAPLAFELVLSSLTTHLYGNEEGEVPGAKEEWGYLNAFLLEDFDALTEERRLAILEQSVAEASSVGEDYQTWGDFHRMRVGHALANIPVIGPYFFELFDYPVGGSRATPMKTNHDLETERHTANYGSMSRHISDMGDPNANWFVLFGGQDGWWGSPNFADQMPLWREREFIRMPLDLALVEEEFPIVMTLEPASQAVSGAAGISD
ncbi:MAG: penicillin acylase family protein [Pseudomonadota bacterium]